jgi:hypothetical protein
MFINWKRYSQLGKILGGESSGTRRRWLLTEATDVCRFQQPYNLKEIPEVQEYLAWAFELSGAPQDADELQRLRYEFLFPWLPSDSHASLSLLVQPRERNDPRQNSRAPDILGFARDLKVARTASAISKRRPVIDAPSDHFNDPVQTLLFEHSKPRSPLACIVQVHRKYPERAVRF